MGTSSCKGGNPCGSGYGEATVEFNPPSREQYNTHDQETKMLKGMDEQYDDMVEAAKQKEKEEQEEKARLAAIRRAAEEKAIAEAAEAERLRIEKEKQEADELERKRIADEQAQEDEMREQKRKRYDEWQQEMAKTRQELCSDNTLLGEGEKRNRYGTKSTLPEYDSAQHVPILALINPMSGAKVGGEILRVAMRSEYYRNRFFNILSVVRGQGRGGAMDVFRVEFLKAVEEAKQQGTRCRLISAGGDGTASFAMFIVFKALEAHKDREDDGLKDTGNGFIWTDAEFEANFPALAQMPLGSANDCGNILGWGQVFPGDGFFVCGQGGRASRLYRWIDGVLNKQSPVVNFDVWGIMPPAGEDSTNFKICELTGARGISPRIKKDGKLQLNMKTTGNPIPFFVCLYFSVGFFGYVVARFQLNRRSTPLRNTMEYIRQGASIILFERPPPQLGKHLEGITIDAGGEPYFPPRRDRGNKASKYRECGFYNINWQAHRFHGADRAPLCKRICCCAAKREPVKFDDGLLDIQRQRLLTLAKNPGFKMQTDKRKDFHLKFAGGQGKGFFFQYDGEARYAFTPDGAPFDLYIRQVLNMPVVIGPWHQKKYTGPLTPCSKFEFHGDTQEEVAAVKRRILKNLDGGLEKEMCATSDELMQARLVQTPVYR